MVDANPRLGNTIMAGSASNLKLGLSTYGGGGMSLKNMQYYDAPQEPTNKGQKMYAVAMEKTRKRQEEQEKKKKELEEKEVVDATFKPKINSVSQKLIKREAKKIEEHLIKQGKRAKDKMETLKS